MVLVPQLVNVPGFGPKKIHVVRIILPDWDILKRQEQEETPPDSVDSLPLAAQVLPMVEEVAEDVPDGDIPAGDIPAPGGAQGSLFGGL